MHNAELFSGPSPAYVYRINPKVPGIFGVLTYYPSTMVFVKVYTGDPSIREACDLLAHEYAATFVPANTDEKAWAETQYSALGFATAI